jgi:hypothetical protein
MKKIILLLLFIIYAPYSVAATPQRLLSTSKQLIVVTTPTWNSFSGQMQRFERNSTEHSWKAIGKPIAVVVGKHGMGWDIHLKNTSSLVAVKH